MDYRAAMQPRQMAAMGQGGDDSVVHAQTGEWVVPPQVMNPKLYHMLMSSYAEAGVDPSQFQVGSPSSQLNSLTGAEMFAFATSKEIGRSGGTKSAPGRDPTSYSSSENTSGTKTAGTISPIGTPVSSSKSGVVGGSNVVQLKPPAPTDLTKGLLYHNAAPEGALPGMKTAGSGLFDWQTAARSKNVPFNDSGMLTLAGLNYGDIPVNNQYGEIGKLDTMGFSPSRAAADAAGLLLPGAGLIGMGLDAAGLMPDDWMFGPGGEGTLHPPASSDDGSTPRAASITTPTTPRSTSFTRPSIPAAPIYLGFSPGMTNLQQRAQIATYATNADDSRYREDEVSKYYDSLLANSLINDQGQLGDLTGLLPIENQYLLNSRNLNPFANSSELYNQLKFA